MKAVFNNSIIAESRNTISLEGNEYFSKESVKMEYLTKSNHTTVCPWKGTASYYNVIVSGKTAENAAWTYLSPKKEAEEITEYIAFWNGVKVLQ